ncbi:DUF4238 domain-containing protein [Bradyrhizobium yuanmingense]|uniref:DUF4238 domain-containing protein n=1 Tax=Bradyrhizobium yuanmingense TaxID=108015 RepID=UPI000568B823|nr:DUF4238 domain-containing protein [Bradyrhizobium yuanmingense]
MNEEGRDSGEGSKMAEPKSHHYVPRFYLRGFSGEKGKLFAVNRPTGHSFRPPPEGVAAENYFNRIDLEGMDKNELEKALAEFEAEMAPALERVKEAKSLAGEEDRAHIMNFMAALALRNPSTRDALSQIHDQLARLHFAEEFRTQAAVDQAVAAGMLATGTTVAEVQKVLADERFPMPKPLLMALEIDMHDPLTEKLWHRKWQIIEAKEGTFVTTDDPICLRWKDGKGPGGLSPGFGLKETEVIFALSPTLCLRGSFEGEENVIEADAKAVGEINSFIISNARNQVYARDHEFKFKNEAGELRSGATLAQDKRFLDAGKKPEDAIVVALKPK